MNILREIGNFFFALLTAPGYAIFGVLECFAEAFETSRRPNSVYRLLAYGGLNIPIYNFGIQVVCRREVIWEADRVFILDVPSALLRMRVHTWDIKEGKLWIKVCINERLLKKLEQEQITRNIRRNNAGCNKQNEREETSMRNENELNEMESRLCEGACGDTERPVGHMDFGEAIRALKAGHKVARSGWNGRGMYLWLKPAAEVKREWCRDPYFIEAIDKNGGESIAALGTICMFTHDSTGRKAVLTGWLPSQSDMLCEDWYIVD